MHSLYHFLHHSSARLRRRLWFEYLPHQRRWRDRLSVATAGYGYRSFSFPASGDTGFACGYDGALMKTVDAGLSWSALPLVTNASLSRVLFPVDAQVGYAVGDQGYAIKTTDGGATWFFLSPPVAHVNFVGLAFPTDSRVGFLAGDAGAVLATHDGGVSALLLNPIAPVRNPTRLSIYPIPARRYATVRYSLPGSGNVRLRLFDRVGRQECSLPIAPISPMTSGECRLDVSRLPAGVYFLEAASAEVTCVARLVVTR